MANTYKILAQGLSTSASLTTWNTILTVGSGKSVIINKILLYNGGASTYNHSLRIVPSGATPGATHIFAGGTSAGSDGRVESLARKEYLGPITLSAGDIIQMSSDNATGYNYFIFGVEIS
jgi:hypothetical protein